MRVIRSSSVLMMACLFALAGYPASAQDEGHDSCAAACGDAREQCVTSCGEHDDPMECEADCEDQAEDCTERCS
jgi:hypothetical protein